ncbi:ethanolamine permease [Clostridium grantii]|uniref:Ethanolamine:proton symporter, EAT family (TC 2.A.3.5.1) n=1 Tax=Clostridium grantii DSM 8605 TaxID=1121316 RepID=A0A1M5TRL4_9CLOT|nr:ethanolamine permease [Clostridium grantii]SHH53321.1 ethanolamine:proton symporter, EAT family (TC 2.A.3.5.1) [Clostridium grantii DSM 8605]
MSNELNKTLKPVQLWGIIVGMVISGMYFGWNYALEFTSPVGFIVATLIVTIFYATFMFSYAELATAIPHAGGPSEYASRAIGNYGGFLAGFACLVEFLFATPAIALAVGAYVHFLFPIVNTVTAAIICYSLFVFINCLGVKTAAFVELFVTIVAIIGLIIFTGSGISHVNINNIVGGDIFKGGLGGIFAAIPFAIWFYLAVEGGAMAAEECKDPKKDIPKGFILAIGTLVVLALCTFFVTAGTTPVETLASADSPLATAMANVFGEGSILAKIVSIMGLFGTIASLHGIIIGYSRQAFAMSRAGYLPKFLSKTNKNGTPIPAIIIPSLIGLVFVISGATSIIIVISSFGAVALYILSMVSLFVLRKKEPEMNRPYKVIFPLVPAIALGTAIIFLVAVTWANLGTILWVILAFILATVYYFINEKIKSRVELSEEMN